MSFTVATEACLAVLNWTGVESSFPAGFPALDPSHVIVSYTDSHGNVSALTLGVQISVACDAVSGAVTVTPIAMPAAPGTLVISRATPANQQTNFANLASFSGDAHTQLADQAEMGIAEARRDLARSALAPLGETMTVLPARAKRASTYAVFDANGNLTGGGATAILQGAPGVNGANGSPCPSQLRLTLTAGTAIMTADVAGATTIFLTPAGGRFVPIWNGAALTMTDIGGADLSNITTNAALGNAGPAAVVASSNYDLFVWLNAGVPTLTRGPPWTSATARGTGAGTTQLAPQNGILVNAVAIANGPGAGLGTYVGTVRSDLAATINMKFGTAAAGGGSATFGLWNAYNRVQGRAFVQDTTATWQYNGVVARGADGGALSLNFMLFVTGLAVDPIAAKYASQITMAAVAGNFASIGHGLDAINTYNFKSTITNSAALANVFFNLASLGNYPPQLGFHFIQALENSDGANNVTFTGPVAGGGLEVVSWY
jgi:hypothetical protein